MGVMALPTTVRSVSDSRVSDSTMMAIDMLDSVEGLTLTEAVLSAVTANYGYNWGEMQWAAVERKVRRALELDA
jgi:hypothetical protein